MIISFFILLTLTIISAVIAYRLDVLNQGLKTSLIMFYQVIPLLIVAMVLAGMLQAIIPKEYITKLLGREAGTRGIVIGALIGIIMPGGPYVSFPLLAVLYKGGASIGALSALLSSWGLIGLFRFITYELPILGAHFAFARYTSAFIFPVIIGIVTELIFGK
jgi:uncharacterized membrane protein YraQ (UPF0718 family)